MLFKDPPTDPERASRWAASLVAGDELFARVEELAEDPAKTWEALKVAREAVDEHQHEASYQWLLSACRRLSWTPEKVKEVEEDLSGSGRLIYGIAHWNRYRGWSQRNYAKAYESFCAGAEQGHHICRLWKGWLLKRGDGVEQDMYQAALEFCRASAFSWRAGHRLDEVLVDHPGIGLGKFPLWPRKYHYWLLPADVRQQVLVWLMLSKRLNFLPEIVPFITCLICTE